MSGWTNTQGGGGSGTQNSMAANGTTTLNITPTGTTGKLLIATMAINNQSVGNVSNNGCASISDSVDGAWTLLQVNSNGSASVAGGAAAIAYRANPSSTAARTVTYTNNTIASAITWQLSEYDFTGFTFSTDGNASAGSGGTAAGTTVTVSGPTPSQSNDLAVGVGNNDNGSAWTAPSGGIWNSLWHLTGSSTGADGIAVYGVNPASGSGMSTAFTETGAVTQVPTAIVALFLGPPAPTGISVMWLTC